VRSTGRSDRSGRSPLVTRHSSLVTPNACPAALDPRLREFIEETAND